MTNIDKSTNRHLNFFGQRVREIREKRQLLLRQIAAHLEVDTAQMSKIERGERNAHKEQVVRIAEILKADLNELLTLWLADKIESVVSEEKKLASDALDLVKKNLKK